MQKIYTRKLVYGKSAKHTGAKIKKLYRFVDFSRKIFAKTAATMLTEYVKDPNRTAFLTLSFYTNGTIIYIIAADYLKRYTSKAKKIYNLYTKEFNDNRGNSNFLSNFAIGSLIYNLDKSYTRSAGTSALILKKADQILIKLKSGSQKLFSPKAIAVSGIVSNSSHFLNEMGTAGRAIRNGIRPVVRACSKNPVDHPLGGRTRGGHPQSKNGLKPGHPTARKSRHNLTIISSRKARLNKS